MSKRKPPRARAAPQPAPKPPVTAAAASTLLLPFAAAIFTGALLLFLVQPLIARYVLPWFGGGPGVWATCMLFFQALLLGGYLYAHLAVRLLPTRGQIVLHVLLLTGSLAMIPIIPAARWKPATPDDPVWQILVLLTFTIGLPYFVLSATSPLLQAWFVKARPNVSPYRLFALSNLGSLLALLGYPAILEPLFTRPQQAWIWSAGLMVFALLCIACAVPLWHRAPNAAPPPTPADPSEGDSQGRQPRGIATLWLTLPLVGSVLLLAVTNTLTEDVAVTPLLWVVPLALYLLTFVIAFDGPRWYPRRAVLILLPLCTLWVLRIQWLKPDVTLVEQFAGYLVALFVLCLFCHGEVARLKPGARDLTRFYLLLSLGGALGGVFVALVAPRVFDRLFELPIGVFAAALLAFACLRFGPSPGGSRWAGLFVACAGVLLLAEPVLKPAFERAGRTIVDRSRNFYGTLVVADVAPTAPDEQALRILYHGSTSHGFQFLAPERRHEPTLYYHEGSGVAVALRQFPRQENRKVGLVGLGVGTLAAYGKAGDTFRFYEINPDVERAAREHFTFLKDSPAKVDVILGDARLVLEREEPQQFDVLVLDAFSGDAIPTHLLTAEAFQIYARHLKPDGVIAAHFSNRSVDLGPVLLRQATHLGLSTIGGHPRLAPGVWWMLMTRNTAFLAAPAVRSATVPLAPRDRTPLWTDDHINLLRAIRWVPNKKT